MSISRRIEMVRVSLGYKPSEFARSINIKHQKVLDIERERQRPTHDDLTNIVSTHNVCGTWLLTGEGHPSKDIALSDLVFQVILTAQSNRTINRQQASELIELLGDVTNAVAGD